MSVLKRVVLGTGATMAANLLSATFSIATTILLLRYLNIQDYGFYALVLSLASFGGSILDLGVRNVVISDVSKELGRGRTSAGNNLLSSYINFEIKFSLIISVLPILLVILTGMHTDQTKLFTAILLSVLIFFTGLINIYSTALYSFSRFFEYALFIVVGALLELLLVGLAVYLRLGSMGVLYCYAAAMALSLAILSPIFLSIRNKLPPRSINDMVSIFKSHGKFAVAGTVTKSASDWLPMWLLQFLSGLEAVGIYAAAFKMFQLLAMVPLTLELILLPTMSSLFKQKKFELLYSYGAKYAIAASICVLVMAAILIAPIAQVAFPAYVVAIPTFFIMAPAVLIYGFSAGQRSVFFSYNAQKQYFYSWVFTFVLSLILGLVFAMNFGTNGMAASFTIVLFLATLYRWRQIVGFSGHSLNFRRLLTIDAYDINIIKRIISMVTRNGKT